MKDVLVKVINWARLHKLWTVIIIIVFIAIASSGGQKSASDTSQPSASTANQTTQQVAKKVEVKSPDPIALSGQGQQASDKFTLESGLAVFQLTHNGSSNFGVWLKDSKGKNVELLANEIGSFNGSKAVGVSAGEYILDVSADGAWTVNITQPRQSSASDTRSFSGTGQAATALFHLGNGLAKFKLTHSGESNFGVWLKDKDGENVELLANEIGSFNGSKAVGVSDGQYILDVSADGPWTITIE
jgi:hypothetical protein